MYFSSSYSFGDLPPEAQQNFIKSILLLSQENIKTFFMTLWQQIYYRRHGVFLLQGPEKWGKEELWLLLVPLLVLNIPPDVKIIDFFLRYLTIIFEDLKENPSYSLWGGKKNLLWAKKEKYKGNILFSKNPHVFFGTFLAHYGYFCTKNHPQGLFVEPSSTKEQLYELQKQLSFYHENTCFVFCPKIHGFNTFGANRLLQILEQPLEQRIFLLTSEKKLLDTLESRCLTYYLPHWTGDIPPSFSWIYLSWLWGQYTPLNPMDKKSWDIITMFSQGSLGLIKFYQHKWPKIQEFFQSFQYGGGFSLLSFLPFFPESHMSKNLDVYLYPYCNKEFIKNIQQDKELFFQSLWIFWHLLETQYMHIYTNPRKEKSLSWYRAEKARERETLLYIFEEEKNHMRLLREKEKTYGLSLPLIVMDLYHRLKNFGTILKKCQNHNNGIT